MKVAVNPRLITLKNLGIAAATFSVVMFTAWVTVSGGLWPVELPGQTSEQALALVKGKLAGVLYQFMSALPALVIYWTAALGLGWWVQERWLPDHRARRVLRLGLGLGLMLLLVMFVGWAGLLNRWTAWLVCAPGVWLAAWKIADRKRRGLLDVEHWPNPPWTMVLCLPAAVMLLITAIAPPGTLWAVEAFGYDTLAYHLQLPKEWIELGRVQPVTHNVYSFLPNLVETGYTQLSLMQGSVKGGVYTVQLWHVSTVLLTAATLAQIVSRWAGATAGGLAAACFLITPWVLITGSSAYNETAALALVATAMLLWLESDEKHWPMWVLMGALFGAATLAKLTIGLMCVPTLAGLMLVRVHAKAAPSNPPPLPPGEGRVRASGLLRLQYFKSYFSSAPATAKSETHPASKTQPTSFKVKGVLVMLLAGLLVLSPWLVRNAIHTGNPVFPFATQILGAGHWQPWQVEAWQRSSTVHDRWSGAWSRLTSRWLTSPGYGSLVGSVRPTSTDTTNQSANVDERFDITRFHRGGGVPMLLVVAGVCALLALQFSFTRRVTVLMLVLLSGQLLMWVMFTHQQARFLVPTLLPVCVLIGLGTERISQWCRVRRRFLPALLMVTLTLALTWNQWNVLQNQTRWLRWDGGQAREPLYRIIDSLPTQSDPALLLSVGAITGDHVINYLPAGSRTLMIADAAMLYVDGPRVYNSAFDRSLLGDALRDAESKNQGSSVVNAFLKQAGITHVWVHWAELERLTATYGYDPAVTVDEVRRFADDWRLAADFGWASLYVLP